MRASIVLVWPFRVRRGRSIVIMMFRLGSGGAQSLSVTGKAYKRGGDGTSMRLGFWKSVVNKAHIPK
jgi:hypothetical protein